MDVLKQSGFPKNSNFPVMMFLSKNMVMQCY